jgi:multiple sugar transport system permease protein
MLRRKDNACQKNPRVISRKVRKTLSIVSITGLALAVLFLFMIPMVYGVVTALKTDSQFSKIGAPWWPATEGKFNYEGQRLRNL